MPFPINTKWDVYDLWGQLYGASPAIVGDTAYRIVPFQPFDSPAPNIVGINMGLKPSLHRTGVDRGAIRALIRLDAKQTTLEPAVHAGLICMQSAADVSDDSGSAYLFGIGQPEIEPYTFPELSLVIVKMTGVGLGGNPSGFRQLATIPLEPLRGSMHEPIEIDDILPIQFEWSMDQERYGGMRLTGSIGTVGDLHFENLRTVIRAVDDDPLVETFGEGLYGRFGSDINHDIFTPELEIAFDEIHFYYLTQGNGNI